MLQYKAYPVKDWEKHNAKLKRDDCDRHSKEGHGPEVAGRALDEWAYWKGIKLSFIRPGKPNENAFAESFNGRLRDECLNTNWFLSVKHARDIIENWRKDYNTVRPHSSLGGLSPQEFMELDGKR